MSMVLPVLGVAFLSTAIAAWESAPGAPSCGSPSSGTVMSARSTTGGGCEAMMARPTPDLRDASLGMMSASNTLVDVAVGADQFSLLVSAVKAAGLVDALSGDTELTVFAPTDDAFGRAAAAGVDLQFLLSPQGRPTLERVLLHHVVPGRLESTDLTGRTEVTTLAGTTLSLGLARNRLFVDDAMVQSADVGADNGVIHVIDRVMLPPAQASPAAQIISIAIERGVPMFNSNNAEGCAAVYATALDAIATAEGFGLSAEDRRRLRGDLDEAASIRSASEQAWAYRRLMDDLVRRMSR